MITYLSEYLNLINESTFNSRKSIGLLAEERIVKFFINNGLSAKHLIVGVNQTSYEQNLIYGDIQLDIGQLINIDVKAGFSISIKSATRFTGQYFILNGLDPERAVVIDSRVIQSYASKILNPKKLPSGDPGFTINPYTFRAAIPLLTWINRINEKRAKPINWTQKQLF